MARLLLINGRNDEELRVAIVADGRLESFTVEVAEVGMERGNVYRGVVARVEPSLDAAFVDYGADRHGFLALHDVVLQSYHKPADAPVRQIDQALVKGRPIVVQVTRDAAGSKGATLTTNISLAGRYLVLMPHDDARGLSRKVEDEAIRKKLKEKVKNLMREEGERCGYIVRTNAVEQPKSDLKRDLARLTRLWNKVVAESKSGQGPRLLYDDQDLVVQTLRDTLDTSVDEVLIDDEELLAKANDYLKAVMPRTKVELKLYTGRIPLFSRYNLEPQVAQIQHRVVPLPSGGSIVIDPTEALTAVDVNSGRSKTGDSQEETAYATNLEAAAEVARQLRLRDIGGLVVIDFIDMRSSGHRRKVEAALREAMKADKARVRLGRLSANGLLEVNRQRIRQALQRRTHVLCPTCKGVGWLGNPELLALSLLRRIEARAATGRLKGARVELHPELAQAIQNRRRREISRLEREFNLTIEIVGRLDLELAEERVQWVDRELPSTPDLPAAPGDLAGEKDAAPVRTERKKTRRRRGSRKKRAVAEEGPQVEAPVVAVPQSAAVPEVADAPAPSKRRRRRRRHKRVPPAASEGGAPPADGGERSSQRSARGQAVKP